MCTQFAACGNTSINQSAWPPPLLFLWHLFYNPTTLELSVILLSCDVFILTALRDSRWFDLSPQQRKSPFFNLLLLVDLFPPRGPWDVPQSVQQEALHHPASDRPSHSIECSPQKEPGDHHHPALLVEEEDAFHYQQVGGWSVCCRCDSEPFFFCEKKLCSIFEYSRFLLFNDQSTTTIVVHWVFYFRKIEEA